MKYGILVIGSFLVLNGFLTENASALSEGPSMRSMFKIEIKDQELEHLDSVLSIKKDILQEKLDAFTISKKKELETEKKKKTEEDRVKKTEKAIKSLKEKIAVKKALERSQAVASQNVGASPSIALEAPVSYFTAIGKVSPTSNGNAYGWGQCTYHVYNKRPDIGSYWGNANMWYSSAQSEGFATGSDPSPGAIGVSFAGAYGHVAYIESVSGNKVNISEMNYNGGVGVVNYRTTNASEFVYIYGKS